MTTAQLDAMRAGRERATEARRAAAIVRVAEYRRWLREDSRAFEAMKHAEANHGRRSPEYATARAHWSSVLRGLPTIPTSAECDAAEQQRGTNS